MYPGSKDEYIAFCTPEATAAIDSYLAYRTRAGEKLNDQSPLFRTDFYSSDIFKVRNDIKPMLTEAVSEAIMVALKGAGLFWTQIPTELERHRRHDVQRNHGFRKFANTQMVLSEVNGAAKEMLLGHSIGPDDKYYRPTPDQLLAEYAKAIDRLTINEENRLRRKVESERQREDKLSIMEGQFDSMQSQLQALITALGTMESQSRQQMVAKQLIEKGLYNHPTDNF